MWYRCTFEIPSDWKNKQVIIHFDAVAHHVALFVNGHKAGTHAGNYDAFSFNITPFLTTGKNTLVVAAQDLNDGRVPSGKSGPRGDYAFCSGIWQSVWLEPVNKTYIEHIRLIPELSSSRLKVLVNTKGEGRVTAVALNGNRVVTQTESANDAYFSYLTVPIR